MTIHAASQIGMADELLTLENGKCAGLTVLENNPYRVDADAIMGIEVSEALVGGKTMFG